MVGSFHARNNQCNLSILAHLEHGLCHYEMCAKLASHVVVTSEVKVNMNSSANDNVKNFHHVMMQCPWPSLDFYNGMSGF